MLYWRRRNALLHSYQVKNQGVYWGKKFWSKRKKWPKQWLTAKMIQNINKWWLEQACRNITRHRNKKKLPKKKKKKKKTITLTDSNNKTVFENNNKNKEWNLVICHWRSGTVTIPDLEPQTLAVKQSTLAAAKCALSATTSLLQLLRKKAVVCSWKINHTYSFVLFLHLAAATIIIYYPLEQSIIKACHM